jgi:methyltransferase-like protein/SAM-dependent methyltransferase
MSSLRDSYDRVPYRGGSQWQSHPDHLSVIALLAGLTPAPPDRCRVLELGCATGGNLIPMAFELTESTFVGIDLSPVQIERGQRDAADLGLKNIDLRAMSILDLDASLGAFDYIICHGVFTWVEREVQEKILSICQENLAPNGIAYISYNTFPGWHTRKMLREMLLFHNRGIDDLREQAERSFALADFLAGCTADATESHAAYLRTPSELLDDYRDDPSYVVHEYLEETNEPLYFHDFAARASAHGLRYIADAEPHENDLDNLGAAAAEGIRAMTSDPIEQEQYVDFVVNRTFRRTLLCHQEATRDESSRLERIRMLHAASACKAESESADLHGGVSERFTTERGKTFSSDHPIAKAALVSLAAAWPRALAFDELLGDVTARLSAAGVQADVRSVLPDLLDSLFRTGVVMLHVVPPDCTNRVSAFPRASALARRQAAAGLLVTNQRRRVLKLDDAMARFLLMQLDGNRDRAALVRLLDREVSAGRLDIRDGEEAITAPQRIPAVLEALVEHHLRKMAQHALLVS